MVATSEGKDPKTGRFLPGNRIGQGNPHAKKAHALRNALFSAVTEEDIDAVIRALIDEAKGGDVPAARELLDRCLGKPVELDLMERLRTLEELLAVLDPEAA